MKDAAKKFRKTCEKCNKPFSTANESEVLCRECRMRDDFAKRRAEDVALIFAFNLFYIDITFDPIEMANNLRKNGGSIPGIRAGKATSDYLRNACHSLAGSGAFVLSVIACVPILATAVTGLNMHFGGTSLLIVTGVTLEVIDSLNSHLVVRHHKGFLN